MFELSKLDPKALAGELQKLLEDQLQAPIRVDLHKFEQTNPGFTDNRVFISFHVKEDPFRTSM